jgi:hypothetical protein
MIEPKSFYIALAAVVLAHLACRYFMRREQDPLRRALTLIKLNLAIVGAFSLFLWWQLPITAVLNSFGYPQAQADIQSAKSLLPYLQESNRALVRTTQVLSYFIFLFVWWFLATLFDLSKIVTTIASNPLINSRIPVGTSVVHETAG